MKKIKGILLFGILTLLGIGSSFGNSVFKYGYCISDGIQFPCYFTGDWGKASSSNSSYYNIFGPLNIGNLYGVSNSYGYTTGSIVSRSNYTASSTSMPGFYTYSGGLSVSVYSNTYFTPYYSLVLGVPLGNTLPSPYYSLSSFIINLDTLHFIDFASISNQLNIRYRFLGNDIKTGLLLENSSFDSYNFHNFIGLDVSSSFILYTGNNYKFFTLLDDGFTLDDNNSLVDITQSFVDDLLIIPLRDKSKYAFTGDYTIVLSYSGSNLLYNLFDCFSSKSSELGNCSVISKGYINDVDGFLNYSGFTQFDNTYTSNIFYSTTSELFYDNNGFILINNVSAYQGNTKRTSHIYNYRYKKFYFTEDSSVPILFSPGGNGSQPFPDSILDGGVFDANTFLIEESIKCYLTSGEVCNSPFTYENSTNYVNNYDHQERVRNSTDKTGYLTFNNSVDMLSQYCLNVNTIQYAFCSQLSLYEGYPITYYYNNGYFNYIISGSGWEVNLGTLWSGQLGYAYCEGPFCSNFNEGLPQFIRKDTGDYSDFGFSGEYVSLDFFKNYFENGFFFQCPFSYSGSYFTIGGKLVDRLDKHDPLKPINCMIAGFSHGIKSSFFGDSKLGLSHSGVFLQNTGPFATRFYTFIDIVLSLGYIFLFSKLFKFLKKH